jgi:hypothetical protein
MAKAFLTAKTQSPRSSIQTLIFPQIARIDADISKLLKDSAGRRCEQKALRQCFLAQPDGQYGLWPCAALAAQVSGSLY